jgi:cyclopropane fatty-acyl-phospholipid synthase-like methyltransferase
MRGTSGVGTTNVRAWAWTLPHGAAILDLGCGSGVPITEALIADGFAVHGIDASPIMAAEFRKRFPSIPIVCEAFEDSTFFGKTFHGVVAWGLMFLLSSGAQQTLIKKAAAALESGGRFLFTSRERACTWTDVMTGRDCLSLGAALYRTSMAAQGLTLVGESQDEGENHYYDAVKV